MNRKEALAVIHAIKKRADELERQLRAELDDELLDDYSAGKTDRHLLGQFGKLYIRTSKPGFRVYNEHTFGEWAYEHHHAFRYDAYEVDSEWMDTVTVDEEGNVIDSDGAIVPGVEWAEGRVTTAISGCKPEDVFPALREHPELLSNALLLEGENNA